MRKLGYPTLFAHELEIEPSGRIASYRLRMADQKRASVERLHDLRFREIAAGDSYNDTSMLLAADAGILFRPPDNVAAEFPQLPVARNYRDLQRAFEQAAARIASAKS
jgi:phosphoserine/homoserine phosphotransferase